MSTTTLAPEIHIITTAELLERAAEVVAHPYWGTVNEPAKTIIEKSVETGEVQKGLMQLLPVAENICHVESWKGFLDHKGDDGLTGREVLTERAKNLMDSPFWGEVRENYHKHMVSIAALGKIGPKNGADVVKAIETLEGVIVGMQNPERTLRRMGLSEAGKGKGPRKRHRNDPKAHSTAGPRKGSTQAIPYGNSGKVKGKGGGKK